MYSCDLCHTKFSTMSYSATVGVGALPIIKKTIYQQVLKLGANEASAQGLQNAL
jgi:hypothetical protein